MPLPEPDENDLLGWDVERDGRMADYDDIEVEDEIEDYNPDKDPVNKGLVPSPYGDADAS